jgi:diketogulonate reductase-like aldo/keto reductase
MYRNEKGVGEAVRASGLDRSEVYITSKLNNGFHRPADARRAFEENFQIFDFELEPEDIAAITALDRGEEGRGGANRTEPGRIRLCAALATGGSFRGESASSAFGRIFDLRRNEPAVMITS